MEWVDLQKGIEYFDALLFLKVQAQLCKRSNGSKSEWPQICDIFYMDALFLIGPNFPEGFFYYPGFNRR